MHDASDPQAAERAELIARLRSGHEAVVRSADLVATPHRAYQALPPGMVSDPAKLVMGLMTSTQVAIMARLLDLPEAPRFLSSFAAREQTIGPAAFERPFPEVADRFRAVMEGLVGLVESVDLDQRSAQPVWVGDERVHQPARWFLLNWLTAIASTNGRLRELFDLAQGGCLVDP